MERIGGALEMRRWPRVAEVREIRTLAGAAPAGAGER
jgi:hypothetical protein